MSTEPLAQENRTFLEWVAAEYECGVPDDANYDVNIAYLEGLVDGQHDGRGVSNLLLCIQTLKSARAISGLLRRYRVPEPS